MHLIAISFLVKSSNTIYNLIAKNRQSTKKSEESDQRSPDFVSLNFLFLKACLGHISTSGLFALHLKTALYLKTVIFAIVYLILFSLGPYKIEVLVILFESWESCSFILFTQFRNLYQNVNSTTKTDCTSLRYTLPTVNTSLNH